MRQVGWTVEVPGALWGDYASDQDTINWSKKHHNELFAVVVIDHRDGSGFVIRHRQEPEFTIKEADLAAAQAMIRDPTH